MSTSCIYCERIAQEGQEACASCRRNIIKLGSILQSCNATQEEVAAAYDFLECQNEVQK